VNVRLVVYLAIAAVVGGVLAMIVFCPSACRKGIRGELTGALGSKWGDMLGGVLGI
jgi:hypothetical protein